MRWSLSDFWISGTTSIGVHGCLIFFLRSAPLLGRSPYVNLVLIHQTKRCESQELFIYNGPHANDPPSKGYERGVSYNFIESLSCDTPLTMQPSEHSTPHLLLLSLVLMTKMGTKWVVVRWLRFTHDVCSIRLCCDSHIGRKMIWKHLPKSPVVDILWTKVGSCWITHPWTVPPSLAASVCARPGGFNATGCVWLARRLSMCKPNKKPELIPQKDVFFVGFTTLYLPGSHTRIKS